MPRKHHPMWQASVGTVFAVAIADGRWGVVRFFRGRGIGVLDIFCDSPVMPKLDWQTQSAKWVFFCFAPDADLTEAVPLGVVPFANPDAEWPPPCFDPPDVIDNCYRIHARGFMTKTKAASDVSGMVQCQTLTPAKLAEFLRERFLSGDLRLIAD